MQKIYQFLLASIIGIELFLGIVVAPVIFYPQRLGLVDVLTHYQSGIMMSEIFSKMGYMLIGVSFLSLIYEILTYQKKLLRVWLSALIALLSALFVFYFSSFILHAQGLGESATQTPSFQQIHTYSEWTLRGIVLLQCWLFFLPFSTKFTRRF